MPSSRPASEYYERALDQEWHGTLGRREPEPPDAEETVRASARRHRRPYRDLDYVDLVRDEAALNPYGEDIDGALPAGDLEDLGRSTYLSGQAGGTPWGSTGSALPRRVTPPPHASGPPTSDTSGVRPEPDAA